MWNLLAWPRPRTYRYIRRPACITHFSFVSGSSERFVFGLTIQFFRCPSRYSGLLSTGLSTRRECHCPSGGDHHPPDEGHDRACPSGRDDEGVLQSLLHRTQEKKWVETNLRSASSESGPIQAPIQDALTETHPLICSTP